MARRGSPLWEGVGRALVGRKKIYEALFQPPVQRVVTEGVSREPRDVHRVNPPALLGQHVHERSDAVGTSGRIGLHNL
eukprot:scaffold20950_cov151-Isochrysis_galbana.AAC.5